MSDKALEQRRNAAALSTGPRTEDGKAISSRNNWKHGLYSQVTRAPDWQRIGMLAKPCRSTCEKYPCSLVDDGTTRAGGDCMDKRVYVDAFDAIISTLQTGDVQYSHGVLAAEVAGAIEILHALRRELMENGLLMQQEMFGKDGRVIGTKVIPNPLLSHYWAMLDKLGISLPAIMATPQAVSKQQQAEETGDAVAELFTQIANAGLSRRPGRVIDGETANGED